MAKDALINCEELKWWVFICTATQFNSQSTIYSRCAFIHYSLDNDGPYNDFITTSYGMAFLVRDCVNLCSIMWYSFSNRVMVSEYNIRPLLYYYLHFLTASIETENKAGQGQVWLAIGSILYVWKWPMANSYFEIWVCSWLLIFIQPLKVGQGNYDACF